MTPGDAVTPRQAIARLKTPPAASPAGRALAADAYGRTLGRAQSL